MNISVRRLQENGGDGLDDRPEYVSDALSLPRRVGWQKGKPLVPRGQGANDGLQLGDSADYSHYVRGSDLLRPDAGSFLKSLFEAEEVTSLADASEELNSDRETVKRAADLHEVEIPDGEESADQEQAEGVKLPSGETVPFDATHPLVLGQLLSDGMGVEEVALYLSEETGENLTPSDVREAAQEYDLLDGRRGSALTQAIPDGERTVTAKEGEPTHSPWT